MVLRPIGPRLGRAALGRPVQRLPHKSRRIDLVFVLTGRKAQQFRIESLTPESRERHVQPVQGHAAADGLRPDCLVAAGGEGVPRHTGLAFPHAPLQEGSSGVAPGGGEVGDDAQLDVHQGAAAMDVPLDGGAAEDAGRAR